VLNSREGVGTKPAGRTASSEKSDMIFLQMDDKAVAIMRDPEAEFSDYTPMTG
jgi:hypothetical protein